MSNDKTTTAKSGEIATKSKVPVLVRVLAIVLVLIFISQFILMGISRVSYSADKYDGDLYSMARFIQENDEYLNAGYIQRLRNAVITLGKPKTFQEYYLFASAAIADNDYAKATEYLDSCIEMYEGAPSGLAILNIKQGCLYALMDNWTEAKKSFNQGVEQNPENADAWLMLAKACYNTEDYPRGIEAMDKVFELKEPGYEEYAMLASLQYNGGNYADAIETCTKALTCEDCDKQGLYYMRAKANYFSGKYADARSDAEKCISQGGDKMENTTFIAACYEGEKDYAAALKVLMDMIDSGVEDENVYQSALTFAYELDDYATQEKIVTRLMEYDCDESTELSLRSTLAIAQLQQDKFDEAEKNLNLCLEKQSGNAQLIYLRGVCKMNQKNYDKAYDDFSTVIDSGVLIDECYYNRAVCKLGKGDAFAAESNLNIVIKRNANPEMVELSKKLIKEIHGEKDN